MGPSRRAAGERRFSRSGQNDHSSLDGSGKVSNVRVLFAHQNLGQFGGAEANIQLTAERLNDRGHELHLAYQQGTQRSEAQWSTAFRTCYRVPQKKGETALKAWVADLRPDLLYLHNLTQLELLQTLVGSGIPAVRMVHDHSPYCMRSYKYNYFTRAACTRPTSGACLVPCLAFLGRGTGGWPLRWVSYSQRQTELALTRRCRQVVVYSEYQRGELMRNGFSSDRITTCAPIRMLAGYPGHEGARKQNLILYAGQIVRGKGVDVLLRVLAGIHSEFRCIILGEGNHRTYCQELSHRLGLGHRVDFRGYVPPAESQELYRQAQVFVMSSLWPEPFGMAGPEAMRYGLPVVAFDAGGIREWLTDGHNGYLVNWKDVKSFTTRLEELLNHPHRAQELGRAAAQSVQQFESTRQVRKLEALFQRTVGTESSLDPDPESAGRVPISL
jgi:glycosyltransferase involved in cell wall biosynthesis